MHPSRVATSTSCINQKHSQHASNTASASSSQDPVVPLICPFQHPRCLLRAELTASSKMFLPSMAANISARSRPVAISSPVATVFSMPSCCFHLGSGSGTRADKNRAGINAVATDTYDALVIQQGEALTTRSPGLLFERKVHFVPEALPRIRTFSSEQKLKWVKRAHTRRTAHQTPSICGPRTVRLHSGRHTPKDPRRRVPGSCAGTNIPSAADHAPYRQIFCACYINTCGRQLLWQGLGRLERGPSHPAPWGAMELGHVEVGARPLTAAAAWAHGDGLRKKNNLPVRGMFSGEREGSLQRALPADEPPPSVRRASLLRTVPRRPTF